MARKTEPSHITENQVFPARLRELMEEQQVTQKKLADAIEMRPQTVSLYTTGQSSPDINTLRKMAVFFNVTADYLLGLTDVKKPNATVQAICEYTGLSETAASFIHYNRYTGIPDAINSLLKNKSFLKALDYISFAKDDAQSVRTCAKSSLEETEEEWARKCELYSSCVNWLRSNFMSVVIEFGEYRQWRTRQIVKLFEDSINEIFDEIFGN